MRRRARDLLFTLGDTLGHRAGWGSDAGITRPRLSWLAHQVSELGWRLR